MSIKILVQITEADIDSSIYAGWFGPIVRALHSVGITPAQVDLAALEAPTFAKVWRLAFWSGETVGPINFEVEVGLTLRPQVIKLAKTQEGTSNGTMEQSRSRVV